ncbi:hypothetical protein CKO31_10425 [Thiohalocapsa halophila]|uniref:Uncharacterized protein n=1 Tax=Thiohalocapsa halophila TaxID=69359 RepID=A0ABS1CI33_9GAMM|nr:hypothetical protein [Thiohalocapsa halophila]
MEASQLDVYALIHLTSRIEQSAPVTRGFTQCPDRQVSARSDRGLDGMEQVAAQLKITLLD